MPRITLPDGTVKSYDEPVSAGRVAADIGAGLAKAAIGAKVDGELRDLSAPIDHDAKLELITAVNRKTGESSDEALYLIRHSAAHVMAEAIQRIVPGALLVYGPPVESGFYYDIAFPSDRALSTDDFAAIELEMKKIIEEDRPFTRVQLPVDVGFKKLKAERSKYKLDNAQRAAERGAEFLTWYITGTPSVWAEGSPEGPKKYQLFNGILVDKTRVVGNCINYQDGRPMEASIYEVKGKSDWEDLCMGPHVPSTGRIGAFKVTSLASSYWHGDAASDSLTRVYGTAFATKEQLDEHLNRLDEAKKRDHRVLGKQLQLFALDEMVGPGLVLWKPNGAIIRQELMTFIGDELRKQGYFQVFSPHIGRLELYKTSGHFPYYQDSQYPPIIDHEFLANLANEKCSCGDLANRMNAGDIDGYLLKPMNCPHHIRIFASQAHSYRDLPVRLAEFGTVYRYEQSGEIGGMTRVRGFTQDDAHLFCTEDQIADELIGCLDLVKIIFETLGMKDFRVRVGLRDPSSDKYVGNPRNWDKAEDACRKAAKTLGASFTEEQGEAAFYGPKIDFVVKDVVGREWQLGTVQVDYNLPERFDLSYIGPDNQAHRPVMIHRAPFGSFERFIGCLIEHFAGAFPTWLAPEQVRVLPISEKSLGYGQEVVSALKKVGVRATIDTSDERIQAKIRNATEFKIPYLLVVGPRDAESRSVSVRARGILQDLGALPLDSLVDSLKQEIASRGKTTVLQRHFEPAEVS